MWCTGQAQPCKCAEQVKGMVIESRKWVWVIVLLHTVTHTHTHARAHIYIMIMAVVARRQPWASKMKKECWWRDCRQHLLFDVAIDGPTVSWGVAIAISLHSFIIMPPTSPSSWLSHHLCLLCWFTAMTRTHGWSSDHYYWTAYWTTTIAIKSTIIELRHCDEDSHAHKVVKSICTALRGCPQMADAGCYDLL